MFFQDGFICAVWDRIDISLILSTYKGGPIGQNSSLVPKRKHLKCAMLSATSSSGCDTARSPVPYKINTQWVHTSVLMMNLDMKENMSYTISTTITCGHSLTHAYHTVAEMCPITAAIRIDACVPITALWCRIWTSKTCGHTHGASLSKQINSTQSKVHLLLLCSFASL